MRARVRAGRRAGGKDGFGSVDNECRSLHRSQAQLEVSDVVLAYYELLEDPENQVWIILPAPARDVSPCSQHPVGGGGCDVAQLATVFQNKRDFIKGIVRDDIVPVPAELPAESRLLARETHEVRFLPTAVPRFACL